MRTVKVDKIDLMNTLERNGRKHVEEYEKALEGYWQTALQEVTALAQRLGNKDWDDTYQISIDLVKPTSHAEEYDTAIEMLDWSTEDIVELTQQEFKQFVQDEWAWKQQFAATNSTYIG